MAPKSKYICVRDSLFHSCTSCKLRIGIVWADNVRVVLPPHSKKFTLLLALTPSSSRSPLLIKAPFRGYLIKYSSLEATNREKTVCKKIILEQTPFLKRLSFEKSSYFQRQVNFLKLEFLKFNRIKYITKF